MTGRETVASMSRATGQPRLRLFAGLAWLLVALTGPAKAASPALDVAQPVAVGPVASADAFLDSMGVGAHWDYKDTVYRHADALVAAITRLGIRHVRGFDPEISPLLARCGVTTMLTAGPEVGQPAEVVAMVRRANAARQVIDAVEGPNEADLFWSKHRYRYEGMGFPGGLLAYQRDLYAAFKTAPGQSGILVIGPSLGRTYDPGGGTANPLPAGSLLGAVDLGNFHPYPFGGNSFSQPFSYGSIERYYWNGNFPSVNLDAFPYAFNVYAPPFAPRPMAATETGYPTWRNGVSERVQAIYLPRLFAEYFRLGIRRTYLYELADIRLDPGGGTMDDHFGLLRHDLTAKPGFQALRGLIALVREGLQRTPVAGAPPDVALSARMPRGYSRASFVHSLLLRVSDVRSLLLVWHEVADADTSAKPPRTIDVPDGRLEVSVAAPYQATAWYGYGPDWALHRHHTTGGTIEAPLQDRIVAVSLERVSEKRQ